MLHNRILGNVLRHKLEFRYDVKDRMNPTDVQRLIEYVCNKDSDWQLTAGTLSDIHLFFDARYTLQLLREQCEKFQLFYHGIYNRLIITIFVYNRLIITVYSGISC